LEECLVGVECCSGIAGANYELDDRRGEIAGIGISCE
jgi:hypothetical protein